MIRIQPFAIVLLLLSCISLSEVFGQEKPITIGDALEVIIYGDDALSQTIVVNGNGFIDYPAMKGIPVDGLTVGQFEEILVAQLSRYLERPPLVSVRFSDSFPISITVLGQVVSPGAYIIENSATFQALFVEAGGLIPGAQLGRVSLTRNKEGLKTTQVVNLEDFYMKGDIEYLPRFEEGDIVIVPGNPLSTSVRILGGVERPGSYEVSFGTSLIDIIYLAGGPTNDADLKKIQLATQANPEMREFRFDAKELMATNDINNVPMIGPGDAVYIPKKRITWGKFTSVFQDLTVFATLAFLIIRVNNF